MDVRLKRRSTGEADIDPPRRLAPRARQIFALALAIYVAAAAWLVWRTAILEPYSDMFDWLERYYRFEADGDLGRYLWAPHNFHHMVATFSVLALDVRAFGGSGYLFLVTGAACWAVIAAMMALLGAQAAGRELRLIGGGGAAALALMGCHALDATADINTTYLYALAPATGAILLWESRWRGRWPRVVALALAGLAGLGSAAGLAIWPALLVATLRRRAWRWTAAVLVCGIATGLLYLVRERALAPAGSSAGADRLLGGAGLVISYLSLPWGRGVPAWGGLVGALVLALSLASLVAALREGGRLSRTAAALIVFSLTTAVMAGVARSGLMGNLAPMRYAVFLIPLHVGVWMTVLPALRRLWLAQPKPMERVAIAAAALMIIHQGVMAIYAVRTADENRALVDAFRAGARTPAMLTTIYPDLAKARAIAERLRRDGLYQRELRAAPAS